MCYQGFDCEATNHTDFRVFYGNTVHVLNRKPCILTSSLSYYNNKSKLP